MPRARKRFGQHFLHDGGVIEQICRHIAPQETDHIVEIGPGTGALTRALLAEIPELHAIEIDRDLVAALQRHSAFRERLHLHQADALRYDFSELAHLAPLRVVGNLPYNISTPLLFHVLDYADLIRDMHFMLQREVAERLAAAVHDRNYGRLSVMAQYRCRIELLMPVPPQAFRPPPQVASAVVSLTPVLPATPAENERAFAELVTLAFGQRRKTVKNNLQSVADANTLKSLSIDPGARPQNLSVEDYVRISNGLHRRRAETT